MKNTARILRTLCVLAAGLLTLAMSRGAFATANPATWNGGSATTNNWSDTANWTGAAGNPSGAGQTIVHFAGGTRLAPNNDYGAFTQFNQILFDSGASSFTLGGNAIKLAINGGSVAKIENNSVNLQTVSFLSSGDSVGFIGSGELDPTAGDLTINNDIFVDTTAGTISVFGGGGHVLTLNGRLINGSATASLTGQTNNVIVLNAVNTYSGDTTILGGKLQFSSTGSANNSTFRLGSTSGTATTELDLITLTGGTTLSSTINPVTTSGTGLFKIDSQNTSNTNTLSGHVGVDRDFTINQATGGTLAFTQARAGGAGTTTGFDIKTHTVTLTGGGTINFTGDVYNSTGSGTGTLIMNGTGTATLGGAQDNVSLAATVNSGTLVLGKTSTSAIHAIGSGLTIAGGTAKIGNTSGDQIANTASVTVTSGAFDLNDAAETFTTLSIQGTGIGGTGALLNSGVATGRLNSGTGVTLTGDATFGITNSAASINLNDVVITDGASSFALTKVGAGSLVLGQSTVPATSSTFDGGVNDNAGTLIVNSFSNGAPGAITSGPLGTGTLTLNGGALRAGSGFTTGSLMNAITLAADTTIASGGPANAFVLSGAVTITGATRTLTSNSASDTNFSGAIGGAAGIGLNIAGTSTGAFIFSGANANTYSGLTTINSGILTLSKSASVNAIFGDVTVSGGTLNYGSNNNQIADSAKLTITSGTFAVGARTETIGETATSTSGLALSGTGAVTIGSGTLNVVNGAMTGGSVTLTAGSGALQANNDLNFTGGTIDFTSTSGTSTAALNLRGGTGTGITYSATGTSTAQITNSGGGTARVSLNTSGTTIFNIADAPTVATEMSIAPSITGSTAFQKSGAGVLLLTGNNTFSGATTISTNGGTLNAGAAGALGSTSSVTVNGGGTLLLSNSSTTNRVNNTAGVTLAGGTISIQGADTGASAIKEGTSTGGTTAAGFGALTLTANSTLDFGSGGVGTLVFAGTPPSSFFPGGFVLNIINYSTTADAATQTPGTDGTDDRLIFFGDQSANLGSFSFGGMSAYEIALGGGYFEITPVPEASTWIMGALALSSLLVTQRRRLQSAFRSKSS